MALTYNLLGKYIHQIDERNKNLITDSVLGINIDKFFMPSVANVIGTDLSNYKLLRKNRFACNPMHVGRDSRLPVCLYQEDTPAIVSPAYFMFEINDTNELDPEYLMLCFRRPLFDRYCTFKTDASVRGGISWEDLCSIDIPMPSTIEEQRKFVNDYKVITDRIELLEKINTNLEEQASTIYKKFFIEDAETNGWTLHFLKEYFPVITGKKDANIIVENGKYQFFSCSVETLWTNEYSFNDDAILIAGNGDFSVKWYSGIFEAYQRTYVLIPNNRNMRDLLYYAIKYALPKATRSARGSVISFITKGILEDISFYMPNSELEIKQYCNIFTTFNKLIDENKKELLNLNKQKSLFLTKLAKGV